jgi:hypothetical protein
MSGPLVDSLPGYDAWKTRSPYDDLDEPEDDFDDYDDPNPPDYEEGQL